MPYKPNLSPLNDIRHPPGDPVMTKELVPVVPLVPPGHDDSGTNRSWARTSANPDAIVQKLAGCGSSDCTGCYEVAPDQKIHPPKAGKR
jgi:hypothetical protein